MKNTFGQSVKQRRKQLGLTQKELGDKIGYKFQNVSAIERGKALSDKEKWKFAEALERELLIKLVPIKRKK